MPDDEQLNLFQIDEPWKEEWKDMPEFVQDNQMPAKTIHVHFETLADMDAFSLLLDQQITPDTRSIWFPKADNLVFADKHWVDKVRPPEPPDDRPTDQPLNCNAEDLQ